MGWILAECTAHTGQSYKQAATQFLMLEEDSLDAQLQCFWAIEEFHILPKTAQKQECESHFQANTTQDYSEGFVMQLPQKSGHKGLNRSYDQALLNFSSWRNGFSTN
jgi:SNF2 family DNA or RNA helicase